MKKLVFIWFLIGLCKTVSAQLGTADYDIISHEVRQGETIRLISLKYLATPSDIYKLNKFAINGIEQGMVLMIPVKRKSRPAVADETVSAETPSETPPQVISHTVVSKETLYSIAKRYGVTVDDITKSNPELLAHGLQAGQVIRIKPNK